jgi:hypothetical protein
LTTTPTPRGPVTPDARTACCRARVVGVDWPPANAVAGDGAAPSAAAAAADAP